MFLNRRQFVQTSLISSVFTMLGKNSFVYAEPSKKNFEVLTESPNSFIELPKGFSCQQISQTGDLMSDGLLVPGAPDGMASFQGPDENTTILVRNHELTLKYHINESNKRARKTISAFENQHNYQNLDKKISMTSLRKDSLNPEEQQLSGLTIEHKR